MFDERRLIGPDTLAPSRPGTARPPALRHPPPPAASRRGVGRPLLAAAIAVAAIGCRPPGPTYVVKLNEEHGHLANGVKVILLPDSSVPLVEVDVRYRVGSKEDPRGKAGLAHLVEHLLFLQRQAGPDQGTLGAALRRYAVAHNAQTTWDFTHYQTLALAEDFQEVVTLEGLRLATGCGTITPETLRREREVVKHEIRLRQESPAARQMLEWHKLVYPAGHPYARSVGGAEAELESITLEDVCAFVRDFYVPERAIVVIAGDFALPEAHRAIQQSFGGIAARPGAPLVPVPPLEARKRRMVLDVDGDESSAVLAWPLPPGFGPNAFFNSIAGTLLEMRATQFGEELYDTDSVEAAVLGGPRAPLLVVRLFVTKAGDLAGAADRVLSLSNRTHWGLQDADRYVVRDDPNSYALRDALVAEAASRLETLPGRAFAYADFAQFEEGQDFAAQVKELKEVDGERLKAMVQRTLGADRATVILFKATGHEGGARVSRSPALARIDEVADELPVDARDALSPVKVPAGATPPGVVRRFTLGNGLRVVLRPTEAAIPIVSATLTLGVGTGHDPPGRRGVAFLAALFHSFRLGAMLAPVAVEITPDTTVFTGRTVSYNAENLLRGLEPLCTWFRVSQSDVRSLRRWLTRDLKQRLGGSKAAMSAALGAAVYGADHPYASAFDPSVAARFDATDDEIEDFVERHYRAKNATLVVTGVFDPAALERSIRDRLGRWSAGAATPPITAAPHRGRGPIAVGVAGSDSESLVEVRIAYPAPAGIDPAYPARLILVEMLSRRVAAVRERLGAAYAVNAVYAPTVGPSLYGVAGAVGAAQAGEALATMRAAFDGLRRGDGFLEDFVRARAAVVARLVAECNDPRSLGQLLAMVETFRLPAGYANGLPRAVAALTPRDVLALARKELDPAAETLVCEGPRPALAAMFAQAGIATPKMLTAKR